MPPAKVFARSANAVTGATLTVDFIDTGQGNAVLVSYPNGEFMLCDCGSQKSSDTGPTFASVQKYITKVTGGKLIKCVVLSHGDEDHTAFVPYIEEAVAPDFSHWTGRAGDYSAEVNDWLTRQSTAGRGVYWYHGSPESSAVPEGIFGTDTSGDGQALVYVLSGAFGHSPNSMSLVLLVRFGDIAIVLPGDADTSTEAFILTKIPQALLNTCLVLMPGHHGAYESTGAPWVAALRPSVDVISSGVNNGYGHPACATNALLEKRTVEATPHTVTCADGKSTPYDYAVSSKALFVTATNGDVRFVTNGTEWKLMASSAGAVVEPEPPHPQLAGLVRNAPWQRSVPVMATADRGLRLYSTAGAPLTRRCGC